MILEQLGSDLLGLTEHLRGRLGGDVRTKEVVGEDRSDEKANENGWDLVAQTSSMYLVCNLRTNPNLKVGAGEKRNRFVARSAGRSTAHSTVFRGILGEIIIKHTRIQGCMRRVKFRTRKGKKVSFLARKRR